MVFEKEDHKYKIAVPVEPGFNFQIFPIIFSLIPFMCCISYECSSLIMSSALFQDTKQVDIKKITPFSVVIDLSSDSVGSFLILSIRLYICLSKIVLGCLFPTVVGWLLYLVNCLTTAGAR